MSKLRFVEDDVMAREATEKKSRVVLAIQSAYENCFRDGCLGELGWVKGWLLDRKDRLIVPSHFLEHIEERIKEKEKPLERKGLEK